MPSSNQDWPYTFSQEDVDRLTEAREAVKHYRWRHRVEGKDFDHDWSFEELGRELEPLGFSSLDELDQFNRKMNQLCFLETMEVGGSCDGCKDYDGEAPCIVPLALHQKPSEFDKQKVDIVRGRVEARVERDGLPPVAVLGQGQNTLCAFDGVRHNRWFQCPNEQIWLRPKRVPPFDWGEGI